MSVSLTKRYAQMIVPTRFMLIAASLSLLAACQAAVTMPATQPSPNASASATPIPVPTPLASSVTPDTPQDLSLRLQADASLAGFATSAAEPFRLCLSQIRAVRHRLELQMPVDAGPRAVLEAAGVTFEGDGRSFELTRATSLVELLQGLVLELKQIPATSIKGRSSFLGPEGLMLGFVDWEADGASLQRTLSLILKRSPGTVSGEGCPLIDSELQGGRTLSAGGGIFNSPTTGPSPTPQSAPPVPANLRLVEQSGSSLTLQWDFPAEARSFKLWLDGREVAVNHVTPNYYRFEGLRERTNYSLGVSSVNAAGESEIATLKGTTLAAGGRSASGNFSSGGNGNTDSDSEDRIEGEFQVNQATAAGQDSVDVAVDASGNYMLVWENSADEFREQVYARVYASTGQPLGDEFAVAPTTNSFQVKPRVAASGEGEFLVVWEDSIDTSNLRGKVFDSRGEAEEPDFEIFGGDTLSGSLSVAGSPQGFVVAWGDAGEEQAYARLYERDGEPRFDSFQVNLSSLAQDATEVAMDAEGNFVVVYVLEDAGTTLGLAGRRFDSRGQDLGSEFTLNQASYDDIRDPAIAMDEDGDFAVVWSGYDDNFYPEIYLRRFEPDGTPASDETVVNTATDGYQNLPDIAMDGDGDFAVSWQDPYLDGSDYAIYVQRYRAGGRRRGGNIQVNEYTTGEQNSSALALDAAGQLIVTWVSAGQDGDLDGVFARLNP